MSVSTPAGTPVPGSATRQRRLLVIVGSSRPGRQAERWGRWIADLARAHSEYEVEIADLAEIDLPLFDEPNHPRRRQYTHEHTKNWSALVDGADAYVFVTPEYNYGYPAVLKNAIDYLFQEWKDKPAGIVSYGGISGGLRSAHQLKQVLGALGLALPQATVPIPFAQQHLTDDGGVEAPESVEQGAIAMLAEMERLGKLLRPDATA